jgi:DNA-binding CsgD family transcriptional regulator
MSMTISATEKRILDDLMKFADDQELPLTPRQVKRLAGVAARAAERGRPVDQVMAVRPKRPSLNAQPEAIPAADVPEVPAVQLDGVALQVLRLIAAEGLSNAAIAMRLGLREQQVKYRVKCLMAALGAGGRVELPKAARRHGILVEGDGGPGKRAARPPVASGSRNRGPGSSSASAGRREPLRAFGAHRAAGAVQP